jgi:hypothetical protein
VAVGEKVRNIRLRKRDFIEARSDSSNPKLEVDRGEGYLYNPSRPKEKVIDSLGVGIRVRESDSKEESVSKREGSSEREDNSLFLRLRLY